MANYLWKKSLIIPIIFLAIAIGCVLLPSDNKRNIARKSFVVTIEPGNQQKLFEKMMEFALENGFSYNIDTLSSSNDLYQIYLDRQDVFVSASNTLNPEEFYLSIFDRNTDEPIGDLVVENLVRKLESKILEVPTVMVEIRGTGQ